jgi:hypothetical protein
LDIEAKGENEIILGESTESVIVGRHEIAVIAAINGILGGLWEIHVPEKWTAHNLHAEIHTEHLGAEVKHTVSMAVDSQIHAQEEDVSAAVNGIFVGRMQAIGNDARALAGKIEALEDKSAVFARDVRASGSDIKVIDDRIRTVGTKLGTAGAQLESAGNSLQSTGAKITEAGTDLSESTEKITTAAASINSAGVIMEGF